MRRLPPDLNPFRFGGGMLQCGSRLPPPPFCVMSVSFENAAGGNHRAFLKLLTAPFADGGGWISGSPQNKRSPPGWLTN
jgi:hypothetical protein